MSSSIQAQRCMLISLFGIAGIAAIRCVTVFSPHIYFDIDPAINPSPLAGMGLYGSLVLDVMLLVFCAVGFIGLAMNRYQMRWYWLVLALAPWLVIVVHGWSDAGDLWRGSTWSAAILASVVVAHLVRDAQCRLIMLAMLLAVAVPLLVRSGAQMTHEHADTIAEYEANRMQFLADRGWDADSPSARIYERRLRQPQPTGWFVTTNILASIMLACGVMSLGLLIGAVRSKLPSGWAGVLGMIAGACVVTVYLSGSKGAMLALLLGIVLCMVPLLVSSVGAMVHRFGPMLLLGCVLMAILSIVARGVVLPEAFLGDKSLLFRWHYLTSAWQAFLENPWLGVGPDGVQAASTLFRHPSNPEEVVSIHSIFADWIVTLGVLGVAWIAIIAMMLWKSGRAWQTAQEEPEAMPVSNKYILSMVLTLVVALVIGMLAEVHVLDPRSMVLRIFAIAATVVVAVMLVRLLEQLPRRYIFWPLAASATALLIHSQIEMTMFLHGSVLWGLCLIGLAAGCMRLSQVSVTVSTRRIVPIGAAVLAIVFAGWVLFTGVLPAKAQQGYVRDAVQILHPPSDTPTTMAQQRLDAVEMLLLAYDAYPQDAAPLRAAIRQLELAGQMVAINKRADVIAMAMQVSDRWINEHPSQAAYVGRASVHAMRAHFLDEPSAWQHAAADALAAAEYDPHGNTAWALAGDYLWQAGEHDAAADAYRKALIADDNFELDPLKQLPEQRRLQMESRIRQRTGA